MSKNGYNNVVAVFKFNRIYEIDFCNAQSG
jgi:hypothetical protein